MPLGDGISSEILQRILEAREKIKDCEHGKEFQKFIKDEKMKRKEPIENIRDFLALKLAKEEITFLELTSLIKFCSLNREFFNIMKDDKESEEEALESLSILAVEEKIILERIQNLTKK